MVEFKLDFSNWKSYLIDPFKDDPKYGYSKFMQKYAWIVVLLMLLFVNWDVRSQNIDLDIADQWAYQSIQQNYVNQQLNDINTKFPNVDSAGKNQLAQKRWAEFESQNKNVIDQQAGILSEQIKRDFQNDEGETYLIAIDPYYYLRQAENLVENGHVGEALVDGKSVDTFRLAPNDNTQFHKASLHPYFAVYTNKLLNLFVDISLYKTFFILPIIGIMIAMIFAFLIGRQIGNTVSGFVFSYIVGFHGSVLGRTVAGFSDTDMYAIFFPLMILYFTINLFKVKDLKWQILNCILLGLVTGLFSFAWSGYWYFSLILIGALFLYLLILIYQEFKLKRNLKFLNYDMEVRSVFLKISGLIVSKLVFIGVFSGFSAVYKLIVGPFEFLFLKSATSGTSIWPNVYTTVAELNPSSFANTLQSLSGTGGLAKGFLLVLLGLIGIIWILTEKSNSNFNIKLGLLGLVWFGVLFWTTFSGMRFIMVLVLPFGYLLALFFGQVTSWLSNFSVREFKFPTVGINFLLLILVVFSVVALVPINGAYATGAQSIPSMNDAWVNDLSKIKMETSNDSIITSWWDFGHQFITIADRGVTFDGGSQAGENAHWVGRLLLTDDEKEAMDILRMLHCSNYRFTRELENQLDNYDAIRFAEKIIFSSKEEAKKIIADSNLENKEELLEMSHCQPAEGILITSEDMVGKAAVWAHFGGWDFDKAYAWTNLRDLDYNEQIQKLNDKGIDNAKELIDSMNINAYDQESANNWISPWPGYAGTFGCTRDSKEIKCAINAQGSVLEYVHDLESDVGSFQNGIKPLSFSYLNSNFELETISYENASIPYAMTLYEQGGSLAVLLAPADLANSIFTRLFYMDGLGLKYFDAFDHQVAQGSFDIKSWKIDWDGTDQILPSNYNYNVSHILIGHSGVAQLGVNRSKEDALSLAEEILGDIDDNNFVQMASEHSDDPSVTFNKGNLGLNDLSDFVPEFSNAAKLLSVGQISEVIESPFGYHIILLHDKQVKLPINVLE